MSLSRPSQSSPLAQDPSLVPGAANGRRQRNIERMQDFSILAFLVGLFIVLALTSDVFLTSRNLENVLAQSVAVGLIACSGGLVIMGGGFDLAAGAIYVLSAIVAAKVSNAFGAEFGIVAGILAGVALGGVNALICTVGKINSFVGTLGTSIFYGGAATAISGGGFTYIKDPAFSVLSADILGINVSIIIFAAFAAVCAFLLNRTIFGRHLLAAGDNEEAAKLSGVSVDWTRAWAYMLSGFSAGLAGIVVASRSLAVGSSSGLANSVVFSALAAILVGGVSMRGGDGAIWRILAGVFILAGVSNGFNLNGIDPLYQQMMTGVLILVAVAIDVWAKR